MSHFGRSPRLGKAASGHSPGFPAGLGQRGRDDGHFVDLVGIAAPAQVVDGRVQALEDGAVGFIAAQALCNLIADVAGLDAREDEGIGIARDLGAGELQLADDRETAASNCISPSMARSGASSLAFAVASRDS